MTLPGIALCCSGNLLVSVRPLCRRKQLLWELHPKGKRVLIHGTAVLKFPVLLQPTYLLIDKHRAKDLLNICFQQLSLKRKQLLRIQFGHLFALK